MTETLKRIRKQTDFTYESDGQLKEVRRGNTQRQQTPRAVQQYEYNARGQITGIIDGNHEKTTYSTDGWGRITGTGFSDGVKEGYEYNYAGQVVVVKLFCNICG